MARKKKQLDPINCEVCGKEFIPADKRRRTCSRSCGGKLGNNKAAQEKARKTKLERYGDENYNNRELVKKNLQEKYGEGITNPSQIPEVKAKIIDTYTKRHGGMGMASDSVSEKVLESTKENLGIADDTITNVSQIEEVKSAIKETHEERYGGIGFASEELAERSNSTFKKKYGEDIYNSKVMQEKREQAFLDKYGVHSPAMDSKIKKKLIANYIEKHGGMGNARNSVKEDLINNMKEFDKLYNEDKLTVYEIAEIMNVSLSTVKSWAERLGINITLPNKLNEQWAHFIYKETGIQFEYEGDIYGNNWRVDLYNSEHRLAIEINPTITHTTQPSVFHGKKISTTYHQERAIKAEENNWHLIQVFDWDDPGEIISLIKVLTSVEQTRIFARKCEVKEVDLKLSKEFLRENHRQGSLSKDKVAYGLYYKDKLVQVMTFSKVRFVKMSDNSYELLRLCSLNNTIVVGGASKLLKAFINSQYKPEYIKSFVDYAKGQGKTYEHMGMTYVGLANLNAYYANIDTGEAHKVTTISQRYKSEYDKAGLSQQEYMNERRFFRINDAGNKIYVWRKNK